MEQNQPPPDSEGGFSMVELLIVVVLLGVLAAIALPSFLSYRQGAYEAALRSDLRNAGVAMESYFVAADRYPTQDELVLESLGLPESPGVILEIVVPQASDDGMSFCLTGAHEQIDDGAVSLTYTPARGGVNEVTTCP